LSFVHREVVRFNDCDPMGHLNNAVFSTFLEQARLASAAADLRGGGTIGSRSCARREATHPGERKAERSGAGEAGNWKRRMSE
jgi:hypothetical protein